MIRKGLSFHADPDQSKLIAFQNKISQSLSQLLRNGQLDRYCSFLFSGELKACTHKEIFYKFLGLVKFLRSFKNEGCFSNYFKSIAINKFVDELDSKHKISKYISKNDLKNLVLAATKKDFNAEELIRSFVEKKVADSISLIDPQAIIDLLLGFLQDAAQGISPTTLCIKLYNSFSQKLFRPDIQALLENYRSGDGIDDGAMQLIYNKLNEGRLELISPESFSFLWDNALFPFIEDHLYSAIGKLGIGLNLPDVEVLKMSSFIQTTLKMFFYDTLHQLALNPIQNVCDSQMFSEADLSKAVAHSMKFLELICAPTAKRNLARLAQNVTTLMLPRTSAASSSEPSSSSSAPSHFGIGSYFPGSTSTKSLISFSHTPSIYDAVSVARGMIDETAPHMQRWRSITESENIQMLPTMHCAHTSDWRKKLIQAAEHNIVISGNYCGQHAFDEILVLIREKMEGNPNLKVVIISSPNFVKNDQKKNIRNQALVQELKARFPTQFSVVYSHDVWLLGGEDGYKKSTNHTKYLGIDWGRYYIMGGSAIKDNFNMSGVGNIFDILSAEENARLNHLREGLADLKAEWERSIPDLSAIAQKNQECILLCNDVEQMLRSSPHFSSTEFSPTLEKLSSILELIGQAAGQENPIEFYSHHADQVHLDLQEDQSDGVTDSGLIGMFVPGNFRDMDFVFSDPNGGFSSGRQLFLEMVRLAYRWETLNAVHEHKKDISFFTPSQVAELPLFTGAESQRPGKKDSVTHRIMREPMPSPLPLSTPIIPGFEGAEAGRLQVLYQGPEQMSGTNEFSSKTLELIRNAQRRIVFNHMYFCPTDEIMAALKEAVEQRGVQIEIITCGETENCPMSQKTFGPYNKWNWVKLANLLEPEYRQNVKVFLYEQKKKGLHKKVIVFDDNTVLAGSSNFGYKSLVTSSDHEVNFVAKSEDFAQKTLAICEEDKKLSQEIADLTEISKKEHLQALCYYSTRSLAN
ncbi:MAG: phospholipase D family protein [Verrucomicrobia bacterium]|nr:phospholipase D family protein [Verrucomicrobiota bacterium]